MHGVGMSILRESRMDDVIWNTNLQDRQYMPQSVALRSRSSECRW